MEQRIAEQHEMIQRILSEKHDLAAEYRRLQAAYTSAQRSGEAPPSAYTAGRDTSVASIDVASAGAERVESPSAVLEQLETERAARQAAERELVDGRQHVRELASQLQRLTTGLKISDATAAAVDGALAVLDAREDRAENTELTGLVPELRRAQLEIAELRAAQASSSTRAARWVAQSSPVQAHPGSPGTAAEVATLYEALEQARQAHAEETRVCEAERLARVAAEQMLSEREAATKSMLAARDGELARMHEQTVRLHEQLDSAHASQLAMHKAADEKARGMGSELGESAVSLRHMYHMCCGEH